jgi:hypothetical protein
MRAPLIKEALYKKYPIEYLEGVRGQLTNFIEHSPNSE